MNTCVEPLHTAGVEGRSPLRGAQVFRPSDRGLIPCRGQWHLTETRTPALFNTVKGAEFLKEGLTAMAMQRMLMFKEVV